MNFGGSCGGVLYLSGAILLFTSRDCGLVEKGLDAGRRKRKRAGARGAKRRDASVAEMATKRTRARR